MSLSVEAMGANDHNIDVDISAINKNIEVDFAIIDKSLPVDFVEAEKTVPLEYGEVVKVDPTIEEIKRTVEEYFEKNPINADSLKIDETLKVNEAGALGVNTTSDIGEDNTLPITAAAVHTTVGNIEILLGTI